MISAADFPGNNASETTGEWKPYRFPFRNMGWFILIIIL
jgi:hypothetical protein